MKNILFIFSLVLSSQSILASEKLLSAIANHEVALAKKLIKAGESVNFKNRVGETPLILAADSGYLDLVKLLVEKGADINTKDGGGNTALTYSISNAHVSVTNYLFTKKPEISLSDLFEAAQIGTESTVKTIIKLKPQLVSELNKDGETALFEAVRFSQSKIAKILIKAGADTQIKNKKGQIPLDLTNPKTDQKMIKALTDSK